MSGYNNIDFTELPLKPNRFGSLEGLRWVPQKLDKKSGDRLENVYKTRVKIGGSHWDIEVSAATKTKEIKGETVQGAWFKFTKVDNKQVKRTTA